MNKVICDICGTDYPETAAQCPICGCARAGGAQTSAGNIMSADEEKAAYTYVKGGRFSKANVRKRMKVNQVQESRIVETDYDDDDDELDEEEEDRGSNRGLVVILILLVLAIIAVCSYIAVTVFDIGGNDPVPTVPSGYTDPITDAPTDDTTISDGVACTGVTLTDTDVELLTLGSAWQLSVTVEPENTTDDVIFVSSNENIAAVDETGRITAVGSGEATITVICGDMTTECNVVCSFDGEGTDATDPEETIEATDPEETTEATEPEETTEPDEDVVLKLNRTDFTMSSKDSTWQLYSGDLNRSDITWTSDNEKVATVKDGKVTAVGPGVTKVHAEYKGQKVSCTVRCSFKAEETTEPEQSETTGNYQISINGGKRGTSADITIAIGETVNLTVVDGDGANMQVEWTVSAEDICSVSGRAVTGENVGKVTLTATYEGQTFTCVVRVKA